MHLGLSVIVLLCATSYSLGEDHLVPKHGIEPKHNHRKRDLSSTDLELIMKTLLEKLEHVGDFEVLHKKVKAEKDHHLDESGMMDRTHLASMKEDELGYFEEGVTPEYGYKQTPIPREKGGYTTSKDAHISKKDMMTLQMKMKELTAEKASEDAYRRSEYYETPEKIHISEDSTMKKMSGKMVEDEAYTDQFSDKDVSLAESLYHMKIAGDVETYPEIKMASLNEMHNKEMAGETHALHSMNSDKSFVKKVDEMGKTFLKEDTYPHIKDDNIAEYLKKVAEEEKSLSYDPKVSFSGEAISLEKTSEEKELDLWKIGHKDLFPAEEEHILEGKFEFDDPHHSGVGISHEMNEELLKKVKTSLDVEKDLGTEHSELLLLLEKMNKEGAEISEEMLKKFKTVLGKDKEMGTGHDELIHLLKELHKEEESGGSIAYEKAKEKARKDAHIHLGDEGIKKHIDEAMISKDGHGSDLFFEKGLAGEKTRGTDLHFEKGLSGEKTHGTDLYFEKGLAGEKTHGTDLYFEKGLAGEKTLGTDLYFEKGLAGENTRGTDLYFEKDLGGEKKHGIDIHFDKGLKGEATHGTDVYFEEGLADKKKRGTDLYFEKGLVSEKTRGTDLSFEKDLAGGKTHGTDLFFEKGLAGEKTLGTDLYFEKGLADEKTRGTDLYFEKGLAGEKRHGIDMHFDKGLKGEATRGTGVYFEEGLADKKKRGTDLYFEKGLAREKTQGTDVYFSKGLADEKTVGTDLYFEKGLAGKKTHGTGVYFDEGLAGEKTHGTDVYFEKDLVDEKARDKDRHGTEFLFYGEGSGIDRVSFSDLKAKFFELLARVLRTKKCYLVTMRPSELLSVVNCISKSKDPLLCEKFSICEKKMPFRVITSLEKCQRETVPRGMKKCTRYSPLFPTPDIPLKIFQCVALNVRELAPAEKKQMIDFEQCARIIKSESCGRFKRFRGPH